ncbi:hypothetical protein MRX96_004794 [Rhipicephalus microplus]
MDASLYDQGCLARLALSNKLGCTGRSNAAGASRSIRLLIKAFEVESKLKQGRTQESIAWKSSIFECDIFAAVPCPRKVGLGGRIYVFAAVHIPMDASLYDQGCLARLALSNKLGCTGRSNAAGASRSIRLLIQAFEVESKLKQGRTQESIAWKSSIFECAVFAAVPCPRKVGLGGRIYVFAAVHIPMDASLYDQGCLAAAVAQVPPGLLAAHSTCLRCRSVWPPLQPEGSPRHGVAERRSGQMPGLAWNALGLCDVEPPQRAFVW